MSLFWELRQQAEISEAKFKAGSTARTADEARRHVDDLEDRVERLSLICASMWALLRDKSGLSDADLAAQIQAIDLSDGVADGRVRRPARPCPSCSRSVSARVRRCVYCGARIDPSDPFDAVL